MIVIKHYGFPDFLLSTPINWRINPYSNKNWQHHFMSLRWLSEAMEPDEIKKILLDFYNFHVKKGVSNPYYDSLRGDHTASIRLLKLVELYLFCEKYDDIALSGMFIRLIKQDIQNLQKSSMYRAGHNHALMVDTALINTYLRLSSLRNYIDLTAILNRSLKTLGVMFYQDGLTRENSISYQEYNLGVVCDYYAAFKELNIPDVGNLNINNILNTSKKVLGMSLTCKGEYLPIGDSFFKPKLNLLRNLSSEKKADIDNYDVLMPYVNENFNGYYFNKGLALYKYKEKISFGQTIMNGSNNHKQNDELSFCLAVNGEFIIVDPGYSGILNIDELDYIRSEFAHSTVLIDGEQYRPPEDCHNILDEFVSYSDNEFKYIFSHDRYKNVVIRNIVSIGSKSLDLKYECIFDSQNEKVKNKVKSYTLVLGEGVIVETTYNDNLFFLRKNEIRVKVIIKNKHPITMAFSNTFISDENQKKAVVKKMTFQTISDQFEVKFEY